MPPRPRLVEKSEKPLAQKMALRPGHRLLVLNAPPGYAGSLGPLPQGASAVKVGPADVVQLFVRSRREMEGRLPRAKRALGPGGMLWLTYPKKTSKIAGDIDRDSIREYALTVGLETVAMFAVDDDWSAIRLKAV